jgi:hypothetical protein
MDKGRYIRLTCAACGITLSLFRLGLEVRHAADVIDRPAGTTVIGTDDDQPMLPDLDNWLRSDPDMPPGKQITALPQYMRPVMQRYIFGTPPLFLGWQIDDELPVAA